MQAVTAGIRSAYVGAKAGVQATGQVVQATVVTVVAMLLLPILVSILTLRATVNKDSVQNYTVLSLIVTGSYLIGAVFYVLVLRAGLDSDALLRTLLTLVMMCAAVLVATGGAATLAWDADATVKTILGK